MNNRKRVLCLDFDDVIMRTRDFVEPIIEKNAPLASEKGLKEALHEARKGFIDEDGEKEIVNKHFDMKDRFLEEVDKEYQGIINYDEIISIENTYPNAVEYINYLCLCGEYSKVYIVSHCNISREVDAKIKFLDKYCPHVTFIPVPFHVEKYEKNKVRARTSKANYVKVYLNQNDIHDYVLIDDSATNGKDWEEKGGRYIKFNPRGVAENIYEIGNLNPFDVIAMGQDLRLTDGNEGRKR